MLHQNLLTLYLDDNHNHTKRKSLLTPNFADLFVNLQNFSNQFLGVKNPY
jgi:hypothetical protein